MQRVLWIFLLLGACASADAAMKRPTVLALSCSNWPHETKLQLPTDTVGALEWHDKNWERARAAHDDCRDKLNALVRRINTGRVGV